MVWLQGSVLAGLLLLACFWSITPLSHESYSPYSTALIIVLIWGIVFDGTHVFAMYARTYFAKDAASRANLPGHASFAWLAVGPAVAVVDHLFFVQDRSLLGQSGILFRWFLAAAYVWAYYHLIRQHYGLMRLYSRKAGEPPGNLDTAFLWIGSLYPYLRFSLSDAYAVTNLPRLVPLAWFDEARMVLDVLFVLSMLALGVLWALRQRTRPTVWGPKHGLLAIVVAFNMLVLGTLDSLITITAVLTIFHNLQYHRIVWLYEKGRNRVPMGSIALYACLGLLFGLLWYGPRVMGTAVAPSDLWLNVLLGLGWGVAFHHYAVDARIWRVRRTPDLGRTLDAGAR